METLKMLWRTALFLGGVALVFTLYTVGVALVERHFSPKYAKKHDMATPVAEAPAPQAESHARELLESGQLTREQNHPELQNQSASAPVEHTAGFVAGATGQSGTDSPASTR